MNRTNIQATLDVLRQAQAFNVRYFQHGPAPCANTAEELHACGNTACIAGYVAISPGWKAFGGVCRGGQPELNNLTKEEVKEGNHDWTIASLMKYWELPAEDVASIIYGDDWSSFRKQFKNMPVLWEDMAKDDAVSLFEQLLEKHDAAV